MSMGPEDLRLRTKSFAVRVVRLYKSLPPGADAQVLGRQLLRSGTSVAANYRAACRARSRARSRAEWIAKIGVVVEEADESVFWLEMLSDCGVVVPARLKELMNEANELTALFSASRQTARKAG